MTDRAGRARCGAGKGCGAVGRLRLDRRTRARVACAVGRPDGVLQPDLFRPCDRRSTRHAVWPHARHRRGRRQPLQGFEHSTKPIPRASSEGKHVVGELIDAVGRHPFVTVIGASGSGKSSVIRAGLVPHLRDAGHLVVTIVPGEDPGEALRVALAEVSTGRERSLELIALSDRIARQSGHLVAGHRSVRRVLDAVRPPSDAMGSCWRACRSSRLELQLASSPPFVRTCSTGRSSTLTSGTSSAVRAYVLTPLSPTELARIIVTPAGRGE